MNIRDIAKAAGVSPATVSRVLNHRDEALTAETRSRVQQIIKEMNYVPFGRREGNIASRMLGVLLKGDSGSSCFLDGVEMACREEGYGVMVQLQRKGDSEEKLISLLQSRQVDGIICRSETMGMVENGCPIVYAGGQKDVCFNVKACARELTQHLIAAGHTKIACITEENSPETILFTKGFYQAMREAGLPAEEPFSRQHPLLDARIYQCTAAICESYGAAACLHDRLRGMNIQVPGEFSVACLQNDAVVQNTDFPITCCVLSERQLGSWAARTLVSKLEGKAKPVVPENLSQLKERGSIASPHAPHLPGVLVVGAINTDILLRLPDGSDRGPVRTVLSRTVMPGGKGLNQAIGCRRLGAEAALLGRLGRDYAGTTLYSFLQSSGVKMTGVSMDTTADTGCAYVTIDGEGESSILIDLGANEHLTAEDVRANERLFEGIGFCLLQTELSVDVALESARLARKHGARVILKPCNNPVLSDELLKLTDYLIPNKHELPGLCPGEDSLEDKAGKLLEKGVGCVIVTLGHNGCMLVTRETRRVCPSTQVHVVDTTGACDAFAAALAVFLLRGEPLESAVGYANCAAGMSCEQQGVSSALPDLASVRRFYYQQAIENQGGS